MTETDIVDQVYRTGDFASRAQAEAVTRATLRNLGSGLSAGEARDLAEFLPSDSGNVLVGASQKSDEPLPYETFLEQVGDEADIADSDVERCARAVVAVVAGRVGVDELENAQAQLPSNYGRLFNVEPVPVGRPFVTLLAERATFPPGVEAETVARAVLEALSERLTRGEAEDLSRYLEGEAGTWVIDQESPNAAAFSADEFVDRVARRANVSNEAARKWIRVVADVLAEVVPSHELERALDQLPTEFDSLFGFEV